MLVLPNDYNLFPNGECDISYIFYDTAYLNTCIKHRSFPKECSNQNVFQRNQNFILNIHYKKQESLDFLIKNNFEIYQEEESHYKQMEFLYNSIESKMSENFEVDFLYLATLIGYQLKKEENAKWVLIKERGEFNNYFVPALVNDSGRVWYVFRDLLRYKRKERKGGESSFNTFYNISIKQIMGHKSIKNLSVDYLNEDYYKILE